MGAKKEQLAGKLLELSNVEILEYNYRCKCGEIDIIAKDGEYLCFVEVKYRSGLKYGAPEEAVDYRKQNKIRQVAKYYMVSHHILPDAPIRFDVVAIYGNQYKIIKNGF